ncbi:hypothetical protein ElyMa_005122200 [Elysia marginata]|uniref:Uncharacterized protein n=1 Tax=Elysia marginata TaxID=1093978 RepID=A0AAV4JL12_9GAST|nr:hypothetical protein ElyMa_005122200 [Elysia marginata]
MASEDVHGDREKDKTAKGYCSGQQELGSPTSRTRARASGFQAVMSVRVIVLSAARLVLLKQQANVLALWDVSRWSASCGHSTHLPVERLTVQSLAPCSTE